MVYTIISDEMQSYDLPPKTIKIIEKIEDLEKQDARRDLSIREKYKKLHSFIIDLLGKTAAKEFLKSDKFDEIDMSLLTITYKKIIDAYEKPIADYSMGKVQQQLEDIPLEKVTELIKATEDMKDRK